mgnify:CR=1 FL=1
MVFSRFTMKGMLVVLLLTVVLVSGCVGPPIQEPKPIEVKDETFCNKDEDCVITSYTYECCGAPCGGAIINKQAFEKREQWTISHCTSEDYDKCPQVNCFFVNETAVCENNKCVKKILG